MKSVVAPGIWIGVLCGIWMLVIGYSGWYKDPVMLNMFFMVILIQIGVLVWGLRRTAAQGSAYWAQVGAGTLMSVVAAALIFCISLLFTTVLFPQYFSEIQAMQVGMLKQAGKSEAEIAAAVELSAKTQTPLLNAISGVVGTIVTGFVASLVIGAFARKK